MPHPSMAPTNPNNPADELALLRAWRDAQQLEDALTESLCEESLADYIRLAWPIIEPSTPYLHNWHIDLISEYLMAVTTGQIKRLIINMPPRYAKSICVSIMFPTWLWGPHNMPGERFVFASYAQKLSTEHSVKRRVILDSPWYKKHWGDRVSFTKDQNEKTHYANTARGEMFAIPMTAATGFGGNWHLIDDPHSTEDAASRAEREAQIAFYDQALSVRHDDKFRGVTIVVMQRLATDDLTGHLLAQGGWTHLKIPGEARERTAIVFPLSGKRIEREPGDLLWPEREGPEQIAERKRGLGSRGWASQYDQEPVPIGGAVFHAEWWRYYKTAPAFTQTIISLDSAQKTGKQNDHSVFTVWGLASAKCYLRYVLRLKVEFPDLKRWAAVLIVVFQPTAILVEDASSGSSLIQEFREPISLDEKTITFLMQLRGELHIEGDYDHARKLISPPILPIRVDKDKLARAEAVTPMVERGDVLLPDPAEYYAVDKWLPDYLREFALFTGINDAEDDQIDSTTQLLNYARELGSFNVMDHYKRAAEDAMRRKYPICWKCNQPIKENQPFIREMERRCHVNCPPAVVA